LVRSLYRLIIAEEADGQFDARDVGEQTGDLREPLFQGRPSFPVFATSPELASRAGGQGDGRLSQLGNEYHPATF